MSGILDSKSRVIDAIITAEGKRQMAEGTFNVSSVTFTDGEVPYAPDLIHGHEDPTNKFYLEACSLPQDQIVFESNDEGKLNPMRNQLTYISAQGQNLSASFSLGSLKDGKLMSVERQHGRSVTVSNIQENSTDKDRGFIYCDSSGVTGSVLIDPKMIAGTTSIIPATNVAYVGTRHGMGQNQFATAISSSVSQLSTLPAGPKVSVSSQNNVVFIDVVSSVASNKKQLIYSGTLSSPIVLEESAIGGRTVTDEIENANFASHITGLLSSSFDNFKLLKSIATIDRLFVDDTFDLSTNELTFDMSDLKNKSLKVFNEAPPNLNSIDSLFSDSKLSHLDNFSYLPPIVKVSDSVVSDKTNVTNLSPYFLGDYPSWGDNEKILDYRTLMSQLADYKESEVLFTNTSNKNDVMMQFFEVTATTVSKLEVIDFGEITTGNNNDPRGNTRRVFFVGKIFLDNRGTACFVNIFTLMFNKDRREMLL